MPTLIQALSLWQPFASLWAGGAKKIETRDWALRGKLPRNLAVASTKKFDAQNRALCEREPFKSALASLGYTCADDLPLGCIVGLVRVDRVYQFGTEPLPEEPERSFGNYAHGRWGFVTSKAKLLETPIPAKGSQLLWGWQMPDNLKFVERVTPGTAPAAEATDPMQDIVAAVEKERRAKMEPTLFG